MADVPDKDTSSTIPPSDSKSKIFGDTCMGLERNVYEDNNTPVDFKREGTKPKTKAMWKCFQLVDHMHGVKPVQLMHGVGTKRNADHVVEDTEGAFEKRGRTGDGPMDSDEILSLAEAAFQPRRPQ